MSDLLKDAKLLIAGLNLKDLDISGQNFLIDEDILKKEIDSADLNFDDTVLNIGSGFGYEINLISKVCKVIGVEKDVKIFSYLINKYELSDKVQLINEDFLMFIPLSSQRLYRILHIM
jgi:Dimethyladenosine transferase (rRNA methylation)